MTRNFNEFMEEAKPISRWSVAGIFVMGMLMGAALAVVFMWSAVLV